MIRPTALVLVAACSSAPDCPEPDAAACAPHCPEAEAPAAPPDAGLSAFEKGLLDPVLEDIRGGVRPFDAEALGICEGQGRECGGFLGTDAGVLPKGSYMLRAELRVPKNGEWTIDLHVTCTTTRTRNGSTSSTESDYDKSYDVSYAGEERGTRLSPIYKIESPSSSGVKDCTYEITAPHPDGDKVYKGSWSVPEA